MVWVTLATLLVITAYVFYVWILICIAFSQRLPRWEASRADGERRFASFLTDETEDRDSALIWQTQTRSLRLLRSAGSTGLVISRLRSLFDEFARTYPELADGGDFPEWVECLCAAGVVVPLDHQIIITAKGLFILETIERMRTNVFDSRADDWRKDCEGGSGKAAF